MSSKPEKRQQQILEILKNTPIATRIQLAQATGVSTETIRKDLETLQKQGYIVVIHGGAALANSPAADIPFDRRAKKNVDLKRKIAHTAINLIEKDEVIILESATTSLELARVLLQKPKLLETLTIITNSISILSLLDGGSLCKKLHFLGGEVATTEYATKGLATVNQLKQYHADKAFVSGAAISELNDLTSHLQEDVALQQQMIQSATESILLFDSGKVQQSAMYTVYPLKDFDYMISDDGLPKEIQERLLRDQVRLLLA